jgi:putative cell wall-binding protein
VRSAPVLLTAQASLPTATRTGLTTARANGATRVTVVGGPAAVSDAVLAEVRTLGFQVDRVAGADRYRTAAAVVAAGEGPTASNVGIVASGTSTADALAVGPLAYKGKHPLFLVTATGIPASTLAAMRTAGVTSVYIVGGTTVVGPQVVAQLTAAGISVVDRLAGADRSATSVAIANALISRFGFTTTTFNLASGANEGVDALGGAALSGKDNRVLLLTNTSTNAGSVTAFATARTAELTAAGRIFGGTAVITAATETAVETAGGAGNLQSLAVTPADAATLPLVVGDSNDGSTAAAADNRTYTVTGLNSALRYRITLVNASSIAGTATAPTFLSSAIVPATTPATFGVATGEDIADILTVGGTTPLIGSTGGTNTLNTATVFPVNGSITFTIDGTAPGTVVPAVYVDGGQGGTATTGGTNNRLETSATAAGQFAAVNEVFGLGGPTTFTAPQAPSGGVTGATVSGVDRAGNSFTTGTSAATIRYTYDANDLFTVGTTSVGLDAFEAVLSSGDGITGTFTRDVAGVSTFTLTDTNPTAQTATATVGTGAGTRTVTVTATFPGTTADLDQVVVQRAPVTGGAAGAFATIATVPGADADAAVDGVQFVYRDVDVALGSYQYRIAGINDADQGEFGTASATVTTTAPPADTTAPAASATTLTTTGGLAGSLDAGDVVTVRADEAFAVPADGARIRVTDADGSVGELVCGTNVTCSLNSAAIAATPAGPNAGAAAGTVLTLTVTGAPTVIAAGTTPGSGLPATITDLSGITDVAGNPLSLTTGNRTINA